MLFIQKKQTAQAKNGAGFEGYIKNDNRKGNLKFDHEFFFKYFRMTPTKFEELLHMVAPS